MSYQFLGASVVSFNASLGWGNSQSTINVTLVEDVKNGDVFSAPALGTPVLFEVGDWFFYGILQSWRSDSSQSGKPLYSVVIVDPREVLSGVQIILGRYTGSINSIPNIINVYGYLESIEFGNAGVNSGGILLSKVRTGLNAITALNGLSTYGGPIQLQGFSYSLDLSLLPTLPDFYRINAADLSLMELIQKVCDDANHDFFFTLDNNSVIKLWTVNRNIPPVFGAITRFIESQTGAVVKNAGFEFANNVTSKFVTGGPVSEIYIQDVELDSQGGIAADDGWDNVVWQYWGLDQNRNAILGEGIGDQHTFEVDARALGVPALGSRYKMDVGEIRAALDSQESWESYLIFNNNNKYRIDPDGDRVDTFKETTPPFRPLTVGRLNQDLNIVEQVESLYKHSRVDNPHFAKADKLRLNATSVSRLLAAFLYAQDLDQLERLDLQRMLQLNSGDISGSNLGDPLNFNQRKIIISRVYNFVRSYGERYYGRQFMMSVPFISSSQDSETAIISISRQPENTGFIDEENFPVLAKNNLMPIDIKTNSRGKVVGYTFDPRTVDTDGRFFAYVRFDNINRLDFSLIPDTHIIKNEAFDSVFIRCTVEDFLVYRNHNTLFSPRAIIKLPARVQFDYETDTDLDYHILGNFLYGAHKTKGDNQPGLNAYNKIDKNPLADNFNLYKKPVARYPSVVFMPLRSNIKTYGPWYGSAGNGRTVYEQDESLVPWNFTSWESLNSTANARITDAITNQQISEGGRIEFPGLPSVNLGGILIDGGPYVTNISVDIGSNGITTSYEMSTWTPKPYKLNKQKEELFSRITEKQRKFQNLFMDQRKEIAAAESEKFIANEKAVKDSISSSHSVLFGMGTSVVMQPAYNTFEQISNVGSGSIYRNQYIMSMDGIFTPCNYEDLLRGSNLGQYAGSGQITSQSLNPWQSGTTIAYIANGNDSETFSSLATYDAGSVTWDDTRGIGLRLPLMAKGWGYTIDGRPVPGTQPSGGVWGFASGYLNNESLWKTGPVDFRYDEDRGVWGAPVNKLLKITVATDPIINPNPSGLVSPTMVSGIIYDIKYPLEAGSAPELVTNNREIAAYNFRGNQVIKNHFYLAVPVGNGYVIDNQHTFRELF